MASLEIKHPSPTEDVNTRQLCLDGNVCLEASQVGRSQKEPPPSSSARCWQTLKFITLGVCRGREMKQLTNKKISQK